MKAVATDYWRFDSDGLVRAYRTTSMGPKPQPIDASFFSRVHFTDGCWYWTGRRTNGGRGYGLFKLAGKNRLAHRVMYLVTVGTIPPEFTVDHICNEPGCVRPDHLVLATQRHNTLRSVTNPAAKNARKTHCIHGHPLTGENLVMRSKGRISLARSCRTCERASQKAYRMRRRTRGAGS